MVGHRKESDISTCATDDSGHPGAVAEIAVKQRADIDNRYLIERNAFAEQRPIEMGEAHCTLPFVTRDSVCQDVRQLGQRRGGRTHMDFIFMLTRSDQTVADCLETWSAIESVGLTHAGFKDIGAPLSDLRELNKRMQDAGVTTYLEVVSTTPEQCLQSARIGREIGVNRLMGGTQVVETLEILQGSTIEYLPFPGLPVGHPTTLGGSPELVEQQCRAFSDAGCAGVDLLAYRATQADPLDLVAAARRGTTGYLVVAGSVTTIEQIHALSAAGADAFTIGSSVFDGSFSPRYGFIGSQLRQVMEACA